MIETERTIIRRFTENDLCDLHEYLSDAETLKYEPCKPMTLDEVRDELNRRMASEAFYAVVLKETGKMIGNIYIEKAECCSFELGYVFNRRYWNKGYASESCRAMIGCKFAEGAHRIFACCDPENPNSWRLLERLGFAREAHFRQNVYFWTDANGRPIWKDTFVYSLLNRAGQ